MHTSKTKILSRDRKILKLKFHRLQSSCMWPTDMAPQWEDKRIFARDVIMNKRNLPTTKEMVTPKCKPAFILEVSCLPRSMHYASQFSNISWFFFLSIKDKFIENKEENYKKTYTNKTATINLFIFIFNVKCHVSLFVCIIASQFSNISWNLSFIFIYW